MKDKSNVTPFPVASKRRKISLYALGSLVILFGLFMFWATSEIPLPSNAKKEGDVVRIDLSEGTADETERKESLFIVPGKFKLGVSEATVAFYFRYPDSFPYTGDESPVPPDSVRVVIRHHAKIEAARSSYILKKTQPVNGSLKNVPYLVERKGGMEIYKLDYGSDRPTIATYFNFIAEDGSNILVRDSGEWSGAYHIDRELSPHIEITYLPPKHLVRDAQHLVEDVTAIDNVVLKLVQSFQSKHN